MSKLLARALPSHRLAILRQFLRFGTVGFAGFLVDTGVVYGLRAWLGLYIAGLASFVVAATTTWALNRIWTFRGLGGGSLLRQWARFMGANTLGFVLNRGAYFLLVTISPLCVRYPILAILAGVAAGMMVNFHLSRRLVFR
ncbi:MAG: GtrA family protein [Rhodospirillales bacterium]|nr:GtrA family protein [Rhodospirillales bacterium]MDE2198264.1 GtrA family protein [Rhodospirillales bacterium]MDE2574932.1 GtrA family protein [Rhodospirillales bacterium]